MDNAPCSGVIVVVEDEEDTRELLRQLLEAKGYIVATAEDGGAALALLNRSPNVCLVLLDLAMPRMGGLALLAEVAGIPTLSPVRFCITTSAPDQAPPGWPCLGKPVELERLYGFIDEHQRGHHAN